jgi:TetR/AcrR family transcriptional regulator, tetracycline repressor protein
VTQPTDVPWWRPGRDRRQRQLDLDSIVAGAIAVLQREGTDGLTIRRLAAELGVAAASVYWHVPNKQALLDVVLDRLLGDALDDLVLDPAASWRAQAADICRVLRRLGQRQPAAGALLGQRLPLGPNGLRLMEITMSVLARAGFIGERLALGHGALLGHASGQVALQARRPGAATVADWSSPDQSAELGRLLHGVPRHQYPALYEMAEELGALTDDAQFEYGVQRMLDGLEQDLRGSAGLLRRRF